MIRKPKVIVVDGTEGDAPMPTAKELEDRTVWCHQQAVGMTALLK